MAGWKKLWGDYIPEMMATKRVPDGVAWGTYPTMNGEVKTNASQTYNVLVHSFTPGSFKGIIFLCNQDMPGKDQGAHFGEQLSALANGWKVRFGGEDVPFFYSIPAKSLVSGITRPEQIKGISTGFEINAWSDVAETQNLIEKLVNGVYK
jgi:hypothetical protein